MKHHLKNVILSFILVNLPICQNIIDKFNKYLFYLSLNIIENILLNIGMVPPLLISFLSSFKAGT